MPIAWLRQSILSAKGWAAELTVDFTNPGIEFAVPYFVGVGDVQAGLGILERFVGVS